MAAVSKPGHKSTYWTTGRPRSHWRKCSCGWSTSGMSQARHARELFEQHLAAVRENHVDRCYCGCKYWQDGRCIDCGGTEVVDDD